MNNTQSLTVEGSILITQGMLNNMTQNSSVTGAAMQVGQGPNEDELINAIVNNQGQIYLTGIMNVLEDGQVQNVGSISAASGNIQGAVENHCTLDTRIDLSVQRGGSLDNYGTTTVAGDFTIASEGEVNNVGSIDVGGDLGVAGSSSLNNSGTTTVAGDFTIVSESEVDNTGSIDVGGALGVAGDGKLNNSFGTVEAGSIQIGDSESAGRVDNTGTITSEGSIVVSQGMLNNMTQNSSVTGAAMQVGQGPNEDDLINAIVNNQGQIYLTGIMNVLEDGQVQNVGTISSASGNIQGTVENHGTLDSRSNVTIQRGGSLDNYGTTTVAGSMVVADDATLKNSGEVVVKGKFDLSGTFEQNAGSFVANETQLAGSTVINGGYAEFNNAQLIGGTLSVNNEGTRVNLFVNEGFINGRVNVDGGLLQIGGTSSIESATSGSVFIAAQNPIQLGENAVIAVGEGATEQELSNGSVWFGDGSVLQINTALLSEEGLFRGANTGSFTVAGDSQLIVNEEQAGWGTYLITSGFGSADAGLWMDPTNIEYVGGTDIPIWVDENEDGNLVLVVGDNNILSKLPDVAIPNIVNEVISDPELRNPNQQGVLGFISSAVENGILNQNLQAETINDTAQIMAAGGVLVQGMTLVGNVMDITDRHLSYEDVHFKNGQLQRFDGVRLWADALGQRVDASGYDFSGSSAEFDGYNTGFIFGADLMASCDARYGAAFAYQNANIDSNGSAVKTSNEADAYTFALYAAKTWGNFNFIGSLAYTRIDSDLEQSLPGALGAKQGKHTMDVSNDIYTLGLKGEYNVSLSKHTQMVPYVGVRAVWMDTSDEKSKLGGSDAFDYDTDSITQVQFPIGVAFQGMTETKSGWTGRGVIDLSVTPVAGDKDVDTTIGANGLTAQDVVNTEFADDLTGAIRIGISAEKDNMAFGGNLGFSTGGSRDGNVTFGLNARYRF